MATKKPAGNRTAGIAKRAGQRATPSSGLLHKAFQPGNDGYAYLYHWVKFSARPPTAGKGQPAKVMSARTKVQVVDHLVASRALRSETTVNIVDHSMEGLLDPSLVSHDLKQPKSERATGQFVAHALPPGTQRKQAEAWIKSPEGKDWAGGDPVALSATAIRIF